MRAARCSLGVAWLFEQQWCIWWQNAAGYQDTYSIDPAALDEVDAVEVLHAIVPTDELARAAPTYGLRQMGCESYRAHARWTRRSEGRR